MANPLGGTDAAEREAFRAALQTLTAAIDALDSTLDGLQPFIEQAHRGLDSGQSVVDVVQDLLAAGAGGARVEVSAVIRRYEKAMQTVRVHAVRALVDSGAMSMSDVGRAMAISPQMARRLYDLGPSGPKPPPV